MRLQMLSNISLLVVEDDDIARAALKIGLKPYCAGYFEARDGFEGLEAFKAHKIDIILTDIHMPGLNGFEMIEEIKKLKPHQQFIVITSYDTDRNFFSAIKGGAVHFIRKPLNIQDVQNALLIATSKKEDKQLILSPHITADTANETIFVDNEPIFLSNTEHKIFWLFCYNLENVVSYEMIEDFVYEGEEVKKGAIHTAVLRLKKHLPGLMVENLSSKGYILHKFSQN